MTKNDTLPIKEAFERWYADYRGVPIELVTRLRIGDDYDILTGDRLNIAWQIWLALYAHFETRQPPRHDA